MVKIHFLSHFFKVKPVSLGVPRFFSEHKQSISRKDIRQHLFLLQRFWGFLHFGHLIGLPISDIFNKGFLRLVQWLHKMHRLTDLQQGHMPTNGPSALSTINTLFSTVTSNSALTACVKIGRFISLQ